LCRLAKQRPRANKEAKEKKMKCEDASTVHFELRAEFYAPQETKEAGRKKRRNLFCISVHSQRSRGIMSKGQGREKKREERKKERSGIRT